MKYIQKYKGYILAFLIPFIIYFLFFLWKGVFTDKTILSSDMNGQYLPLFQYLKNVLHGSASFPYTFSKGLGGAMYGTMFYYFANPLNLLVYFFEDIPLFFTLLILVKLSLSSLTMYILLKSKFKEEKYLLIFSVAYAFMAYNINYYVNIMWLDGVILAPLIILGIDSIISKKSSLLYIITLFLSIVFNYYIGYILVLFSIIYFFYQFFLHTDNWKEEKKEILHFLGITILIGLMTSFILIPSGLELLGVTRVSFGEDSTFLNLNFLDFIVPTYIGFGNLINPLNYYGFCIFFGTVMIPLVICYFCNKKITRKEKIATLVIYILFLSPILFPFMNRLWHMFTIPMAFNYRYSFLATLFTIIICIRSLKVLEVPKRPLIIFYILYIIFSISVGYNVIKMPDYYKFVNVYKIIVTILLLGINIYLLFKNKIKYILVLLVLEIAMNLIWIGLDSKMVLDSEYWNGTRKLNQFSDSCEENKRCETVLFYTLNDSLLANYYGINTFLSTVNGKTISFFSKAADYTDNRNYYVYHVDFVLDMLLGIDTIEIRDKIYDYSLIDEYYFEDKYLYLYKNPNALNLGYLVSSEIKDFKTEEEGIFFLQELLNTMDNSNKEYFYKLPLQKINDKEYQLDKDKKYSYLYLYGDEVMEINGEELEKTILTANRYGVIYDVYGDTLVFHFDEPVDIFEVYVLDISKLQEFKQNRINLEIDKNSGNKIEGHIEVDKSSTLFTTIPYEKGWKVMVDGKKVEHYEVLDTFIALDLEEGYHTITLEYHVYGLKIGLLISFISFLSLICYEYWYKKSITHQR